MAGPINDLYDRIMDECYAWPVKGPEALGPAAGTFRSVLEDDAAVAAANVGTIAVVGPDGEEIPIAMTNAEVMAYAPTQGHKASNEALKYLRDHVGEKDVRGVPGIRSVELTTSHTCGGLTIPTMTKPLNTHSDEGMDYTFHHELPYRNVDWKAVIVNLPTAKRDQMLRNNHVCRMTLEWVPDSYDRKRRGMAQKCTRWTAFPADVPVYVWDWHILLSDGSVWRFHTDWTKKTASIAQVKPGDQLPQKPVRGINESDGRGSYRRYKIDNYKPTRALEDANSAVAEAESAAAGVESAVAVAGTAASSSNAVGSPTVAPTELDSPTVSVKSSTSLDVKGGVQGDTPVPTEISQPLQRTRHDEMKKYKERSVSGLCPPVESGSAVRQEDHSDPRSGWSAQNWGADEWSEHTHGYGVTSGIGATSIVQPNDAHMHAEFSALFKQDEGNQEGGDGTYENKAARVNEMDPVHYTEGRSTDAAADPGPRPPTPDPVPYTGGDVRRITAQETAAVAARADSAKYERTNGEWWRSNNEWSSRWSNQ